MAYYLQKELDANYYAIIDITNKPKKFFQEQDLVKFEKTWFYHDYIKKLERKPDTKYLREFEEKYGINLWKIAINERIFYRFNRLYNFSRNEILSILEQECKLFESILDSVKPDYLITYYPPLHHHKLFHDLCKIRGIKVLGLYIARLGSRCIITDDGENFGLKDLSSIKDQNLSVDELEKIKETTGISKVLKDYLKGRESSTLKQLKAVNEYVLHSDSRNMHTHYTYYGRTKSRVLMDSAKLSLQRKQRTSFIDKNLETNLDTSEPYVYFPLNPDEELNILEYAPFYTNQIEVIRHIAKSLPINFQLFTKEHPAMKVRGWRSISEYKEIMNIPNVKLFHPSSSHESLFENSSLVVTIRGTSALEAAFNKKPAIVFGNVPELVLSSIYKVQSLDSLPKTVKNALSTNT